MKTAKVLGASLGACVHVAGIQGFLRMCEDEGHETVFLGPAVPPRDLAQAVEKHNPDIVAVSYRLTPEAAAPLFQELKGLLEDKIRGGLRCVFGGTPPAAAVAEQSGLFERVFTGTESLDEIRSYIRGEKHQTGPGDYPADLVGRIRSFHPYPLIRHHFGRPTLEETVAGVEKIAEAGVLDVLSIGPDQNAQASFFRPADRDPAQDGAGGVPLRRAEDLEAIYAATRRGNFPLVRCYSGTRDLDKWAEMSLRTIHIAWAAIPLCWYSDLDGRSTRPLREAMAENLRVIRWYAEKGTPVEVNESHQWSLRNAHDALAVTMAFLAAYNAKAAGVRNYVSQYMFNTPAGTSPAMDLAKMLAKIELIEGLADENFTVFREVRAGLSSMPADFSAAKGHLAASGAVSMSLAPHIFHVVGFSEGDHAVTADELIESCKIARGALELCLLGLPDPACDPRVQERKAELIAEAGILLEDLKDLGRSGAGDPWTDPEVIAGAVEKGILDTPHFKGHRYARGRVVTRIVDGACRAVDPQTGESMAERERLAALQKEKS
ncbi:MAG: cobalamin-dependent protein [Acidobacteriota bacterium]|nr:cobalamin-dependent protein [Acidobacteriota bacterium]